MNNSIHMGNKVLLLMEVLYNLPNNNNNKKYFQLNQTNAYLHPSYLAIWRYKESTEQKSKRSKKNNIKLLLTKGCACIRSGSVCHVYFAQISTQWILSMLIWKLKIVSWFDSMEIVQNWILCLWYSIICIFPYACPIVPIGNIKLLSL